MGERLGQHFLKNLHKLRAIADAIDIKESDVLIEIGPGHGELTTEILAKNPKKLIAIEKDKLLLPDLEKKFSKNPHFELINGDALEEIEKISKKAKTYKIAGNIPYYITGRIFRVLGELKNKPEVAVFLIQKEVAERICAKSGEMNLLAASIRVWAAAEIIANVGKNDFFPIPKVESAVIKLSLRDDFDLKSADSYFKAAKLLFKQPRKTVFNNLRESGEDAETIKISLQKIKIDPSVRPQELSISDIQKISEILIK